MCRFTRHEMANCQWPPRRHPSLQFETRRHPSHQFEIIECPEAIRAEIRCIMTLADYQPSLGPVPCIDCQLERQRGRPLRYLEIGNDGEVMHSNLPPANLLPPGLTDWIFQPHPVEATEEYLSHRVQVMNRGRELATRNLRERREELEVYVLQQLFLQYCWAQFSRRQRVE